MKVIIVKLLKEQKYHVQSNNSESALKYEC